MERFSEEEETKEAGWASVLSQPGLPVGPAALAVAVGFPSAGLGTRRLPSPALPGQRLKAQCKTTRSAAPAPSIRSLFILRLRRMISKEHMLSML